MIHPMDYQRRKEWFESDLKRQFGVEYHEFVSKPMNTTIDHSLRYGMCMAMSESDFNIRPDWNEVMFGLLSEDEDDYN